MLTGLLEIGQRAGVAPTRALRLCMTAMRPTVATTTSASERCSRLGRWARTGKMRALHQGLPPLLPIRIFLHSAFH